MTWQAISDTPYLLLLLLLNLLECGDHRLGLPLPRPLP